MDEILRLIFKLDLLGGQEAKSLAENLEKMTPSAQEALKKLVMMNGVTRELVRNVSHLSAKYQEILTLPGLSKDFKSALTSALPLVEAVKKIGKESTFGSDLEHKLLRVQKAAQLRAEAERDLEVARKNTAIAELRNVTGGTARIAGAYSQQPGRPLLASGSLRERTLQAELMSKVIAPNLAKYQAGLDAASLERRLGPIRATLFVMIDGFKELAKPIADTLRMNERLGWSPNITARMRASTEKTEFGSRRTGALAEWSTPPELGSAAITLQRKLSDLGGAIAYFNIGLRDVKAAEKILRRVSLFRQTLEGTGLSGEGIVERTASHFANSYMRLTRMTRGDPSFSSGGGPLTSGDFRTRASFLLGEKQTSVLSSTLKDVVEERGQTPQAQVPIRRALELARNTAVGAKQLRAVTNTVLKYYVDFIQGIHDLPDKVIERAQMVRTPERLAYVRSEMRRIAGLEEELDLGKKYSRLLANSQAIGLVEEKKRKAELLAQEKAARGAASLARVEELRGKGGGVVSESAVQKAFAKAGRFFKETSGESLVEGWLAEGIVAASRKIRNFLFGQSARKPTLEERSQLPTEQFMGSLPPLRARDYAGQIRRLTGGEKLQGIEERISTAPMKVAEAEEIAARRRVAIMESVSLRLLILETALAQKRRDIIASAAVEGAKLGKTGTLQKEMVDRLAINQEVYDRTISVHQKAVQVANDEWMKAEKQIKILEDRRRSASSADRVMIDKQIDTLRRKEVALRQQEQILAFQQSTGAATQAIRQEAPGVIRAGFSAAEKQERRDTKADADRLKSTQRAQEKIKDLNQAELDSSTVYLQRREMVTTGASQRIATIESDLQKKQEGINKKAADDQQRLVSTKEKLYLQEQAAMARHGRSRGDIMANIMLISGIGAYTKIVQHALFETVQYAARTEMLEKVTRQMALANGLNSRQLENQVNAMKELNITTQEAHITIQRMVFAQIDASKATQLARVAQDAAIIANVNSSEALERIIRGIATSQTRILHNMGLQVSLVNVINRLRREHPGREPTELEKRQALFQEVLNEGIKLFGNYERAMLTAGKQATSLVREWQEAQNVVGSQFLPEYGRAVSNLTQALRFVQGHAEGVAKAVSVLVAASAGLSTLGLMVTGGWLIKAAAPLGPMAMLTAAIATFTAYKVLNQDEVEAQTAAVENAIKSMKQKRDQIAKEYTAHKVRGPGSASEADLVGYRVSAEQYQAMLSGYDRQERAMYADMTAFMANEYKKRVKDLEEYRSAGIWGKMTTQVGEFFGILSDIPEAMFRWPFGGGPSQPSPFAERVVGLGRMMVGATKEPGFKKMQVGSLVVSEAAQRAELEQQAIWERETGFGASLLNRTLMRQKIMQALVLEIKQELTNLEEKTLLGMEESVKKFVVSPRERVLVDLEFDLKKMQYSIKEFRDLKKTLADEKATTEEKAVSRKLLQSVYGVFLPVDWEKKKEVELNAIEKEIVELETKASGLVQSRTRLADLELAHMEKLLQEQMKQQEMSLEIARLEERTWRGPLQNQVRVIQEKLEIEERFARSLLDPDKTRGAVHQARVGAEIDQLRLRMRLIQEQAEAEKNYTLAAAEGDDAVVNAIIRARREMDLSHTKTVSQIQVVNEEYERQIKLIELRLNIDRKSPGINLITVAINAATERNKVLRQAEADRIEKTVARLNELKEMRADQFRVEYEQRTRLRDLEIMSEADALWAARAAYTEKIALIDKEHASRKERRESERQWSRERADAEIDYVARLVEAKRREIETVRDAAGKVFDAMSARGGGGGTRELIGAEAKVFGRTMFQNMSAEIFGSAQSVLGNLIRGQKDTEGRATRLGRILAGTPFAAPVKIEDIQQHLTEATRFQTNATRLLNLSIVELTQSINFLIAGAELRKNRPGYDWSKIPGGPLSYLEDLGKVAGGGGQSPDMAALSADRSLALAKRLILAAPSISSDIEKYSALPRALLDRVRLTIPTFGGLPERPIGQVQKLSREQIQGLVVDEAIKRKLDPLLALAIALRESDFNPTATSPKKARGIFQLMDKTAAGQGLQPWESYDPVKNIKAGLDEFADVLKRANGNIVTALQMYNYGSGNLLESIKKGTPLPKETQDYTRKILEDYGKLVTTGKTGGIDLATIAAINGLKEELIALRLAITGGAARSVVGKIGPLGAAAPLQMMYNRLEEALSPMNTMPIGGRTAETSLGLYRNMPIIPPPAYVPLAPFAPTGTGSRYALNPQTGAFQIAGLARPLQIGQPTSLRSWAPSRYSQFASGISMGLPGQANLFDVIGGATSVRIGQAGFATTMTGAQRAGAALGAAATVMAGAQMAISGFRRGGGAGVSQGISGVLGAASIIPGPQQPFIMAGALIAGFVSSLFGDPKQKRREEIERFIKGSEYKAPDVIERTEDLTGMDVDYSFRGAYRTTPRHVNIVVNVDAMDSKSFIDRSGDIAMALHKELKLQGRVGTDIQNAMFGI